MRNNNSSATSKIENTPAICNNMTGDPVSTVKKYKPIVSILDVKYEKAALQWVIFKLDIT